MSTIIGIDLGTSTTEAAVFRNGKKEMIPSPLGNVVIPSAVGIDSKGNWVVGERAKAQYLLSPDKTVIEVKRKTGTGESVTMGKKKYSPVEVQSKLLAYVREYASEYLGEEITQAVISVPSYFNDIQRRETIMAGEMAGFTVERILNEPTSAALSYGLEHLEEDSHILVYDLGGGTFDVTLLEMYAGVLDVKASHGDNKLGGKDFDEKIVAYLLECFRKKYGKDLRDNRFASVRMKDEAEKCKIALSEHNSYRILIPSLTTIDKKPVELDVTITREKFEELSRDLLARTHQPIDIVLGDSALDIEEIDQIILVGGSTKMPMISRDIAEYLGIEPVKAVNPDYAVSEGASIQAAILSGEIESDKGIVLTDVNPYTLGIRTVSGYSDDHMSVIIPRNITIPVTRSQTFSTFEDNQTSANIIVYQGDSLVASHNSLLGEFIIGDIPPKPAHEETITVEFSYDINGLLVVTASLSNGNNASIKINMANGAEAEPSEIPLDLSKWKDAEGAASYRTLIRTAERAIANPDKFDPNIRVKIMTSLNELKTAIISQDMEKASSLEWELTSLLIPNK